MSGKMRNMNKNTTKKILFLIINILHMFFLMYSLLLFFDYYRLDIYALYRFFGFVSILLLIQINLMDIQKLGPLYCIYIYMIMSHFSSPLVYFFYNDQNRNQLISNLYHISAMYPDKLQQVFSLCYLGLYMILLGIQSHKIVYSRKLSHTSPLTNYKLSRDWRKNYISISLLIISFYCLVLVFYVFKNNLLNASYIHVKEVLGTRLISYSQMLFWVSITPLAVLGKKKEIIIAMVPGSIIFILLMLTGNRNDVLIPLIIGFSIYCLKTRKIPKLPLIIGFLIIFVLNPTISATRSEGIFEFKDLELGLDTALLEMSQLRPLTVMMENFGFSGDHHFSLLYGLSMLLPTLALINLNIFYSASAFRESQYHIGSLMHQLGHEGLAFSIIGEIFVNFWIFGVVVFFFFIGRLMKKMEKDMSEIKMIVYGQTSLLLLFWSRNSLEFGSLIIFFAIGLHFISKIIFRKKLNEPSKHY